MANRISIAIIGGGLGGLILAKALSKHSYIEYNVYEARSMLLERGASVGIAEFARRALDLISDDLADILEAAGGVEANSLRILMGQGPDQGDCIADIGDGRKTINVYRALLLGRILEGLPPENIHTTKKLVRMEDEGQDMLIKFEDGSSTRVNAVIGADGIHSSVRAFILSEYPETIDPVFSGFWDTRHLVSLEEASQRTGSELFNPKDPRQYFWVGQGSVLVHQLIDEKTHAACIAAVHTEEKWSACRWKQPLDEHDLKHALGRRGSFGDGMVEILLSAPTPTKFSQWESAKAFTYSKGSVCIMGDAAHATTPWQGSGLGMAIEDALVLEKLLGAIRDPSQIHLAFSVYDQLRRPRTQMVVENSRKVGLTVCGKNPTINLDREKLRSFLSSRWDYLFNFDTKGHVNDAVGKLQRLIGVSSSM